MLLLCCSSRSLRCSLTTEYQWCLLVCCYCCCCCLSFIITLFSTFHFPFSAKAIIIIHLSNPKAIWIVSLPYNMCVLQWWWYSEGKRNIKKRITKYLAIFFFFCVSQFFSRWLLPVLQSMHTIHTVAIKKPIENEMNEYS